MTEKFTAVALYTLKYSDKNSIAHILTRERGKVALLLPQGNTPAARRRNALFLPLSQIDVVAASAPGSEVMRLREVTLREVNCNLRTDPVKSAVALFVAELLSKVVIDREDSRELFDFTANAVMLLEFATRGIANFHICFMMKLALMLGVYPDTGGYYPGCGFDMSGGAYCAYSSFSPLVLRPEEADVLRKLDRMTFVNMHSYRFSRAQRNRIMEIMLQYLRLHNSLVGEMKSPEVLSQLF